MNIFDDRPEGEEGITARKSGSNTALMTFAADTFGVDLDQVQQVVMFAVVANEECTAGALGIVTNLKPDDLTPFLVQAMKAHFDGLDKGITIVKDNTEGDYVDDSDLSADDED
jgi:hypothetical protein